MVSPSPRLGVRNPHSKLQSEIAENECTEINSLYGRHKTFLGGGGRERGHIKGVQDCPNFLGTHIISGTGKATDFKFCTHIHRVNHNKSPWKKFRTSSRGHSQGVIKFLGYPYMGHSFLVIYVFTFTFTLYRNVKLLIEAPSVPGFYWRRGLY